MAKSLVVKVTRGLEDPERAHIGCNVATVALASGLDVHLVLAIEGVNLARPGIPEHLVLAEAPPITELLDALYADASVMVCAPCAARRGLGADDFRPGTVIAGSARFVELATTDGATAIVY